MEGLVSDFGVGFQVSEELSGGFVNDSDVEVVDDQDDGGSFVGAADHDVVHFSCSS